MTREQMGRLLDIIQGLIGVTLDPSEREPMITLLVDRYVEIYAENKTSETGVTK